MGRTDAHQHKVRAARPVGKTETGEFLLQYSAAAPHLGDIVFDILLIVKRLRQRRQRDRIHVVGRRDATHHCHLSRISGENADAQTRQPVGLGKGARHEKVLWASGVVEDRLSMKLKIGFVHQNRRPGRRPGNL